MHLSSPRRLLLATAAVLAMVLVPRVARAQGKGEEVQFDTADKVTLKGTYYPGGKGNKSPCVILLHELGSDRTKGGWDELAKALQKKDFAVLAFDFRGHNDSCTVDPMGPLNFWTYTSNLSTFRPGKDRDKIDYKDIKVKKNQYLPWLVNDVAAAKRYLEERNDANDCNASNVFVIGAKEGAAIGALWLAQEAGRRRMIPNPINPLFQPQFDPKGRLYGEDIAGAVWLSMPDKLYNRPVTDFLKLPMVRDKIPMTFVYGTKDEFNARTADTILKAMKSAKTPAGTLPLKVEGKAAGAELLAKDGVEKNITNYLTNVLEKRAEKPWSKRDTDKLPIGVPIKLDFFGFAMR